MNSRPNIPMQNRRRKPLWPASLLALLLMLAAGPGASAVRAMLDRDTVYMGDTFTLTIESDGQSSNRQPDLAPLEKDFEVLGTSTRTQVSIFNGRRSDKRQWHVQLQPRHLGLLHIPSLSVGGQQTAPLELKITEPPQQTAAQAGRHVFIETETDTAGKPVYVQQQIPYTVRLFYDDRLQEGELSAPEPDNAVVERLGKENRYDTVRNGRQYHVIERNYVISPEKSGSLHIPPALFRGRITVPQQQRTRPARSPLEEFLNNSPFANDPFFRNRLGGSPFGNAFANPGQPITVRSSAIDMTIKPRPATASHNWLPAEAVTLTDSWTENPPQLKVGEPVSRTITIQAKGLSGSQIPELAITAPAGVRLYPEAPTQENRTDGTTIYGVRSQTLSYIPSAQGTLDIPAITLDWWDTRHDKAAHTALPAWQLNVLPSAPGSASETQAATPPATAQPATTANADDTEAAQADHSLAATIHDVMQTTRPWLIAGGVSLLALVILLTMLARRARQRHPATASASKKPGLQTSGHSKQPNRKSVLRELENACAANDRQAAVRALLSLGQTYWPDDAPHSLGALAARIEKGQVQLRELDHSLYAAGATAWNGATLWNAFRHGLQEKKAAGQPHDDGLGPLYPNSL